MRTGLITASILFLLIVPAAVCAQAQAGGGVTAAPTAVPASSPAPQTSDSAPASDFSLIRTIGALGLVISLIVIGFLAARKYAPQLFNRRSEEPRMKVIETLPMGDRRSIALVQVDDSSFLVGNTASQISLLARLPWEFSLGTERDINNPEPAAPAASRDGSRKLHQVEKKPAGLGKPKPIPPDVRAKMRQLREALEQ